ncbi:MAG: hypothetical protein GW769_09030 [Alphaproteobacteria bacterium]|nr:hypothetical protein [Alphaproteobacteria bacterium]
MKENKKNHAVCRKILEPKGLFPPMLIDKSIAFQHLKKQATQKKLLHKIHCPLKQREKENA